MTIEELQAQVSDLSAKLEAETTARQKAEADLAAIQLAARKASIAQLAADLGRDLTDAEATAFETMDETVFATMSATLKSFKPAAPDHLFKPAPAGSGQPESPTLAQINAAFLNQLNGKE